MELVSLQGVSREFKLTVLRELGYGSDGVYVTDSRGEKVFDKYIERPVKVDSMVILPGSTIILDDNPLSIVSYLEEYGDVL